MKKERTEPRALGIYLGSNYNQLQGLIKQADTKANIIIALIGALLSTLFTFFMSKSNLLPLWQTIIIITLMFFAGGFAVSVLFPRIAKPTGKFSATYFKDAQNIDVDKWSKKFLESDQEELIVKDLMNNIKAISGILDKKFKKLRIAYSLFGLSILIKIIFDVALWF